ncbi:hypothetical protein [Streptomonospora wellingtoniae]|uniref:Uncharacterized protein n=1 Tax=Streptomonospora wellingtoniae TaxID=3075544 RepID=A0ABU2KUF2_9ACTN|nr:hypothetical protein [Streptomonospora sp. DSM 45055]MDT0302880.1 hypothetical protein [Streptomonospora sp. DSM 45055]
MDTATPSPQVDDLAEYWHVWRSRGPGAAWYASKKAGAPAEWAPTLAADTLPALERLMADPPRRVRTAVSDLQAPR